MSNSFVLVINSGSSSLKFAVIDSQSGDAVLSGLGECFGLSDARMSWKFNGEKFEFAIKGNENHHQLAVAKLVELVKEYKLIDHVVAVGHRVVHGGEKFTKTVRLDESVIADVEALSDLALYITLLMRLVCVLLWLHSLSCLSLLCLILRSTKQCLQELTPVQLLKNFIQTLEFVATASTVRATTS